MSTTTQILFNSPALHSLKRDQLVKLCKIHALKASGKNKELIERLQLHAKTLPPDDPLSIATRSDNLDAKPADSEDEASNQSTPVHASSKPRPGEQWDVVMDTIAEVDEETLRSNRGASDRPVCEFGTNASKGSVTSSLRAIVNSLGLKRNGFKSDGSASSSSSLSSKDAAQASSTPPTSDPNGAPEEPLAEPVPGQSSLQGFPAPSGARLSLTQASTTTTIRLVSNPPANPDLFLSPPKLKPFATSFDLVPGTPGGTGDSTVPVWPLSPGGVAKESLYPAIPAFEVFGDGILQQSPQRGQYDASDMDIDVDMPGGLTEPSPAKTRTSARLNTGATPRSSEKPSAEPVDIFSPVPKPQKVSTRSRLGIPRSEPFVFGSPLPQNNMSNLQFRTAAQSVLDDMNKRLAEDGVEAVDANVLERPRTTEEPTEKQASEGPVRVGSMFDKIHQKEFDKMDSIASHYAAKRGAQTTTTQPLLSKKRKSSLVVKERKPGVPTTRHRPNGPSSVSVKTLPGAFGEEEEEEDVADRRMSKRPRVEREESDPPAEPEPKKPSLPPLPDPGEEARKQKEREAIRRRLEHNKAKRRSSMGRPSLGRAPPPKPARFGFFASAKSLVQNVWNRGAGSKPPSSIPVSKPTQTKSLSRATGTKKMAMVTGYSGAQSLGPRTKRIPSGSSSSSVQSHAAGRSTLAPPVVSGEGTGTTSRTWKSPFPSPNPPSSSADANPRSPPATVGFGPTNNRNGSIVGFASKAASMGAKSNARASATSLLKQTATIQRSRTTSTLMAPTASSLAKMNTQRASHSENGTLSRVGGVKSRLALSPLASAVLDQTPDSPGSPTRADKVFTQPLSPPVPMSLTAAATRIVAGVEQKTTSALSQASPKAKVLAGRRPRISRSKVIARLASQRAAGSSIPRASGGTGRMGGKVRSSMGSEVAGKTRGNDVLMSAKKRVRQSEQARRQSRAVGSASRMDVD